MMQYKRTVGHEEGYDYVAQCQPLPAVPVVVCPRSDGLGPTATDLYSSLQDVPGIKKFWRIGVVPTVRVSEHEVTETRQQLKQMIEEELEAAEEEQAEARMAAAEELEKRTRALAEARVAQMERVTGHALSPTPPGGDAGADTSSEREAAIQEEIKRIVHDVAESNKLERDRIKKAKKEAKKRRQEREAAMREKEKADAAKQEELLNAFSRRRAYEFSSVRGSSGHDSANSSGTELQRTHSFGEVAERLSLMSGKDESPTSPRSPLGRIASEEAYGSGGRGGGGPTSPLSNLRRQTEPDSLEVSPNSSSGGGGRLNATLGSPRPFSSLRAVEDRIAQFKSQRESAGHPAGDGAGPTAELENILSRQRRASMVTADNSTVAREVGRLLGHQDKSHADNGGEGTGDASAFCSTSPKADSGGKPELLRRPTLTKPPRLCPAVLSLDNDDEHDSAEEAAAAAAEAEALLATLRSGRDGDMLWVDPYATINAKLRQQAPPSLGPLGGGSNEDGALPSPGPLTPGGGALTPGAYYGDRVLGLTPQESSSSGRSWSSRGLPRSMFADIAPAGEGAPADSEGGEGPKPGGPADPPVVLSPKRSSDRLGAGMLEKLGDEGHLHRAGGVDATSSTLGDSKDREGAKDTGLKDRLSLSSTMGRPRSGRTSVGVARSGGSVTSASDYVTMTNMTIGGSGPGEELQRLLNRQRHREEGGGAVEDRTQFLSVGHEPRGAPLLPAPAPGFGRTSVATHAGSHPAAGVVGGQEDAPVTQQDPSKDGGKAAGHVAGAGAASIRGPIVGATSAAHLSLRSVKSLPPSVNSDELMAALNRRAALVEKGTEGVAAGGAGAGPGRAGASAPAGHESIPESGTPCHPEMASPPFHPEVRPSPTRGGGAACPPVPEADTPRATDTDSPLLPGSEGSWVPDVLITPVLSGVGTTPYPSEISSPGGGVLEIGSPFDIGSPLAPRGHEGSWEDRGVPGGSRFGNPAISSLARDAPERSSAPARLPELPPGSHGDGGYPDLSFSS
eukprot:jgi/Mesvir1/29458/Mv23033-RA.1